MNIIKYIHYGKEVSVIEHLKGTHKKHCLCYQNCKFFKPNTEDKCEIAAANFELCKTHGVVTPVFECPKYSINS